MVKTTDFDSVEPNPILTVMVSSEDSSLSGRARRYARVGSAVGGLALRFAGSKYLGMDIDKDLHATTQAKHQMES